MRGIIWFREDLRIHDNTALYHAAQECADGIVAVYLIDVELWRKHDVAACRVEFILRGLNELSAELAKLNIPLLITEITDTQETPSTLFKLIKQFNIEVLFFNKQYEINESRRDNVVQEYLQKQSIICQSYHDQTILPPGSVLTQKKEYFSVFTPYKRTWLQVFSTASIKLLPAPKKQKTLNITSTIPPTTIKNFSSTIDPKLWPAGEKIAQKKLHDFIAQRLFDYDQQRDFPDLDSTSKLSPYLASGMISPRQCFIAAQTENKGELFSGNKGALTWMSELIWREFYKHLLIAAPRVSMNRPYQTATKKIHWLYDEKLLAAWQEGKTGYPLVDAAMRQLNQTGWMHNRLRMVVAMFFSKNLFFDWRLGERYFMQNLIDGDLAANNGGWQWSASVGTDAAPYFRVFNPITQSERFDPEGKFIRRYCPELADFDNRAIHDPYRYDSLLAAACGYPKPIVDCKKSRAHAIAAFSTLIHKSCK